MSISRCPSLAQLPLTAGLPTRALALVWAADAMLHGQFHTSGGGAGLTL